jgi:ornithine lipid hydroxylase
MPQIETTRAGSTIVAAPAGNASPAAAPPTRDHGARALLTYGLYPALMVVPLCIALVLLSKGLLPRLLNPILVPAVFVILTIAERKHPQWQSWNENHGDVRVDFGYFFVSLAVVGVTTALTGFVLIPVAATLAKNVPWAVWPHSWPLVAQVGLAFVVSEFGHYWWHRFQHEVPLLWRLHAVHHSSQRLYWLNSARFHPIDLMVSGIAGFGSLIVLGCNETTIALFTLLGTIHNLCQHSNVRYKLGPLNYVFSMAELHRWHHSPNPVEGNTNYGGHLILWDVVFGTRFLPKDRESPERIGLNDMPSFPTTLFAQIASPFRARSPEN